MTKSRYNLKKNEENERSSSIETKCLFVFVIIIIHIFIIIIIIIIIITIVIIRIIKPHLALYLLYSHYLLAGLKSQSSPPPNALVRGWRRL